MHQSLWYIDNNQRLDMHKLMKAFQQFFRENGELWIEQFNYRECGPQLLLQSFLQRLTDGGGRITREHALGRKRTDIKIEWPLSSHGLNGPVQRIVIEIKILREALETCIDKGKVQVARYADIIDADESHLLIFFTDPDMDWSDRIWHEFESRDNRLLTVWTF